MSKPVKSKPANILFNLITKKIIKHKKLDNILSTYHKIYYDYNDKDVYSYISLFCDKNIIVITKINNSIKFIDYRKHIIAKLKLKKTYA